MPNAHALDERLIGARSEMSTETLSFCAVGPLNQDIEQPSIGTYAAICQNSDYVIAILRSLGVKFVIAFRIYHVIPCRFTAIPGRGYRNSALT